MNAKGYNFAFITKICSAFCSSKPTLRYGSNNLILKNAQNEPFSQVLSQIESEWDCFINALFFYFDVIIAVLRWTHDGQEVTSPKIYLSYLENSGSHVILRAERLVQAEITTNIAVSIQGGTCMYSCTSH